MTKNTLVERYLISSLPRPAARESRSGRIV
jgi:hypothetical protein